MNVVLGERMARARREPGRARRAASASSPTGPTAPASRPWSLPPTRCAREWGLDDAFVVGYSGNLGRAHEIDTLLEAMTHPGETQPRRSTAGRSAGPCCGCSSAAAPCSRRLQAEVARRRLTSVRFKPYQPQGASGGKPVRRGRASRLAAPGARGADRAEQVLRHRRRRPAHALHRRRGRRDRPAHRPARVRPDRRDGRRRRPCAHDPRSRRQPAICAGGWGSAPGRPSRPSSTSRSRSRAGRSCCWRSGTAPSRGSSCERQRSGPSRTPGSRRGPDARLDAGS